MAKKTPNAVVKWDERLAAEAERFAEREKLAAGKFISLKAGIMSYNGSPLDGNTLICVILASCHTNLFYEGDYEQDAIVSPTCYALSLDGEGMQPHTDVEKPVADACEGCPKNEWGSSDRGTGKACSNTRRLAVIPAGLFNRKTDEVKVYEDPSDYASSEMAYIKLPVTSVKAYSAYVHSLRTIYKRPPWAVWTKIHTEPHPKHQFKVVFEAVNSIEENEIMTILAERAEVAEEAILFGFPKNEATAAKPAKSAVKTKAPAKKSKKF